MSFSRIISDVVTRVPAVHAEVRLLSPLSFFLAEHWSDLCNLHGVQSLRVVTRGLSLWWYSGREGYPWLYPNGLRLGSRMLKSTVHLGGQGIQFLQGFQHPYAGKFVFEGLREAEAELKVEG